MLSNKSSASGAVAAGHYDCLAMGRIKLDRLDRVASSHQ